MIGHLFTLVLAGKFVPAPQVVVGSLAGRVTSQQMKRADALNNKTRTTNRQTAVRR